MKHALRYCVALCAFTQVAHAATNYSTNFDLSESQISESGAWHHTGLDWALVETGAGLAKGTQTGTAGFNDSYAYLAGFPANHSATGVIHRAANIDASCTHEVEILLRWSDSAHVAQGYECNLAFDGSYAEIVRWEGGLGKYTYLARGKYSNGVKEGDRITAAIFDNTITLSVNGTEVARATDSTYKTGNPGIAFFRGGPCGNNADYAFTSFSATSNVKAPPAAPVPLRLGLVGGLLAAGVAFGAVTLRRRRSAKLQGQPAA